MLSNLLKNGQIISEEEAFIFAQQFYSNNFDIEHAHARFLESKKLISEIENRIIRPPLELQIMGVCLLAHKHQNIIELPVSFAFFIIDHLMMGIYSALISHFRVSYSLCRNIIEASIFEISSEIDKIKFLEMWNSPRGTGGSILNKFKKNIRSDLVAVYNKSWKSLVTFAHASNDPVLSSSQILNLEKNKKAKIITLGGPNIQELNTNVLKHLTISYSLASEVALETMSETLTKRFTSNALWKDIFLDHRQKNDLEELCNISYILSEQNKDTLKENSLEAKNLFKVMYDELLDTSFSYLSKNRNDRPKQ